MATTDERQDAAISSEEARNKAIVEYLWRAGDPNTPAAELQYHARRLAQFCDPNEESRPKA